MMKIIQLIRGDMKQIRRDSMLAVYFIPLPGSFSAFSRRFIGQRKRTWRELPL